MASAQAYERPMYDILLEKGSILNPVTGKRNIQDVGLKDGTIAAISKHDGTTRSRRTYDCEGCLIVPGFIDFRSHVHWGNTWGVNAEDIDPGAGQ